MSLGAALVTARTECLAQSASRTAQHIRARTAWLYPDPPVSGEQPGTCFPSSIALRVQPSVLLRLNIDLITSQKHRTPLAARDSQRFAATASAGGEPALHREGRQGPSSESPSSKAAAAAPAAAAGSEAAAAEPAADAVVAAVEQSEDFANEEQCGACGRGGQLICCERCPAAYHAVCAGYSGRILYFPFSSPCMPVRILPLPCSLCLLGRLLLAHPCHLTGGRQPAAL